MLIDTHHHFWRYDAHEYPWISDSMSVIAADFGPDDLEAVLTASGVDRVVSVQARQSLEETRWLLDLARDASFVAGVVGWAPLARPDVEVELARLAEEPLLKGLRHVVHDEPDDDFILGAEFNRGVGMLNRYGFSYDLLIFERHLPHTIEFVDRHPGTVFVLDHIGKPRIAAGEDSDWQTGVVDLARRPGVYCKVSGMVTEADWRDWTPDGLKRYFDVVLEAFGPERLMFGSDWPVCLLATEYEHWVRVVLDWIGDLSESEKLRIRAATAIEAYRLDLDG